MKNNITRSLNISGINKIDHSYCLLSNISALLSKRKTITIIYFVFFPKMFKLLVIFKIENYLLDAVFLKLKFVHIQNGNCGYCSAGINETKSDSY